MLEPKVNGRWALAGICKAFVARPTMTPGNHELLVANVGISMGNLSVSFLSVVQPSRSCFFFVFLSHVSR